MKEVEESDEKGTTPTKSGENREWEVNQLPFADDAVLVTDSEKLSSWEGL